MGVCTEPWAQTTRQDLCFYPNSNLNYKETERGRELNKTIREAVRVKLHRDSEVWPSLANASPANNNTYAHVVAWFCVQSAQYISRHSFQNTNKDAYIISHLVFWNKNTHDTLKLPRTFNRVRFRKLSFSVSPTRPPFYSRVFLSF